MARASENNEWYWALVPLVVIAIVLIVGPHFAPWLRGPAFFIVAVLLAVELGIIGQFIRGRADGAFIDNRNRLSLSKLQMGAWTVVVLAAFGTAAAYNVMAPQVDYTSVTALKIEIPGELLLAMGIAATSLVATPALLSTKAAEQPSPEAEAAARAANNDVPLPRNGKLAVNTSSDDASWSDIFTGEEVGNFDSPDLGKIQQVFITLLLLGCYSAYVFHEFSKATPFIGELPVLDKSFVWLLGISHASYLAYKAAPHTSTSTPGTQQ